MPHFDFDVPWVDICMQLFCHIRRHVKFWDWAIGRLIDGAKVTSTKINGDDSNSARVGVA